MISIEYRQITLFPTCLGNNRVRVDPDGAVHWSENVEECEDGEDWSAPWQRLSDLDEDELAALAEVVAGSGILDMSGPLVDDTATDGTREEIHIDLAGRHHEVVLVNTTHPAFAAVRDHLRRLRWTHGPR